MRSLTASPIRPAIAALGMTLLLTLLGAPAALAVFPGDNGRLLVAGGLYDPPQTAAISPAPNLGHARWSADDQHVVGVRGSSSDIYMEDPDGSHAVQLSSHVNSYGDTDPTFAPDGRSVAFVRRPLVPCGDSSCYGYELMTVGVDGSGAHALLGPFASDLIQLPEYSPDGSTIVLGYSKGDGAGNDTIGSATMPAGGGTPSFVDTTGFAFPRFSPDGQSLVLSRSPFDQTDPHAAIKVVGLDGASRVSFSASEQNSLVYPTFTPDGEWVSFGDCRPGCGVWSRQLPQPGDPPGQEPVYREDLAGPSGGPLDWEPLVDEPVITSGPSGRVGTDHAHFEFSVPSGAAGHYQCRLDGGSWQACSSPQDYAGLADGPHTFDVRFYVDGEDPEQAPATTRGWTSDTAPPTAFIDQAPSGSSTDTAPAILFHSSEPSGATFRCSLDGEAEYDCTSPQRLTSLADGSHTFAVRAVDDVGNQQKDTTTASWTVTAPASSGGGGTGGTTTGSGTGPKPGPTPTPNLPPSTSCAGSRVTAGDLTAVAPAGTCIVTTHPGAGATTYSARGPVMINGVQYSPSSGSTVDLDERLTKVDINLHGTTTLGFGSFTWTIPGEHALAIKRGAKLSLPVAGKALKNLSIAGLKLGIAPTFEISDKDGGTTKVGVTLELPDVFSGVDGAGGTGAAGDGTLSFDFGFSSSNDKGTRFQVKAALKTAWLFGKIGVKGLSLGVDSGPPVTFEGKASLSFPGTPGYDDAGITLGVGLEEADGDVFPGVSSLSLQVSSFQKPLGYGLFLQRFGAAVTRCGPGKGSWSANAGLSFGPHLKIGSFFDGEPVSLDGKVGLDLCKEQVKVTGAGKVVEVPVGNAEATYSWKDRRFSLKGDLDLSVGGYGFAGKVGDSFFDVASKAFDLEASGSVRLPGFTGGVLDGDGDAVVSSTGVAACFGKPGARAGIGKRWDAAAFETFALTCDVGPYRVSGAARAAQVGRELSVPRGARVEVVSAQGAAAPPKLVLTGPGGARVVTPADGRSTHDARSVVVQDAAARTTTVVLFAPAAGRWSAGAAPGTPEPVSVRIADGRPPVRVAATVGRGGRSGKRVLRWRLTPQPGQQVTFVERAGASSSVLATTKRARGQVAFTPARSTAARRSVVAIVTQDRLPRATPTVARYRVAAPARLRRVGGLRLKGSVLRWAAQPGASSYSVLVRGARGLTASDVVRRPALRLPRQVRAKRVTVLVEALGADGRVGPLTTRQVRAG